MYKRQLPEFRKATALPYSINNPFVDEEVHYKQSSQLGDGQFLKKVIIDTVIADSVQGFAFRDNGFSVGIIIDGHIHKENDVLIKSLDTEQGTFEVVIKSIKPSYLTLLVQQNTHSGNSGYAHEITVNLPDLKQ